MSNPKSSAAGADWTQLLSDPDLVSHLGELLQTYRDALPDKRDQALLNAMREIKSGSVKNAASSAGSAATPPAEPATTTPEVSPPFEPDIFTPSWGQDRRRHPRMKCFVAVELRVGGSATPIWGNLSDTSLGMLRGNCHAGSLRSRCRNRPLAGQWENLDQRRHSHRDCDQEQSLLRHSHQVCRTGSCRTRNPAALPQVRGEHHQELRQRARISGEIEALVPACKSLPS